MDEIKANISMSTDGATRKREDERENEKVKDPLSRRDTISLLKKDTQDSHVVGRWLLFTPRFVSTQVLSVSNKNGGCVLRGGGPFFTKNFLLSGLPNCF